MEGEMDMDMVGKMRGRLRACPVVPTILGVLLAAALLPLASPAAAHADDLAVGSAVATKPAKASLASAKSKAKGKATAKARRVAGASGYQFRIGLNKKATKGGKMKTKKSRAVVFGGLKPGRTYYAKVRAYKIADGRKLWGPWSKAKKVKVRTKTPKRYVTKTGSYELKCGKGAVFRFVGNTLMTKTKMKTEVRTASGWKTKRYPNATRYFKLTSATRYDMDSGRTSKSEFKKYIDGGDTLLIEVKNGHAVRLSPSWGDW